MNLGSHDLAYDRLTPKEKQKAIRYIQILDSVLNDDTIHKSSDIHGLLIDAWHEVLRGVLECRKVEIAISLAKSLKKKSR